MNIQLLPIEKSEQKQFIKDLQVSFEDAVIREFGLQESEEVIPEKDITSSIDRPGSETFHVSLDGKIVGGVVVNINHQTQHNSLELLFIKTDCQNKGLGQSVWMSIERKYPKTKRWETITPYFEKRNIHFYVNQCGFHITEFFNPYHKDPHAPEENVSGRECFFRFEKDMTNPTLRHIHNIN